MFKMKKESRGITLIALVITIIVLLILAGVSIAMLTGQNGILTQAQNAKIEQSHGAVRDSISLAYNEYQIELNTASTERIASTEKITIQGKEENVNVETSVTFLNFLDNKKYIKEDTENELDVEKLTGAMQALGNGTGTEDVYKVEEQDGKYIVNYYKEGTVNKEIWSVNKDSSEISENTPNWEEFFTFNEETGTITGIVENTSKDTNGIGYYYEGEEKVLSEENVVVPETINGVTVKSISAPEYKHSVFTDCYNLKSIILPDTITYIETDAFQNCRSLTEIILPKELKTIGTGAFNGCLGLTSIRIPSSVTTIHVYSGTTWEPPFENCPNLTSIVLEKGSPLEIPEDKWGATNATITREQ